MTPSSGRDVSVLNLVLLLFVVIDSSMIKAVCPHPAAQDTNRLDVVVSLLPSDENDDDDDVSYTTTGVPLDYVANVDHHDSFLPLLCCGCFCSCGFM